ncbi:MerR family transcriptional regulator [Nocardia sp. NPDC046763]|uniref:MerR family transcriptional regulator n=1 Tax=Nocardia sp. NPDC046763 TaxID=3155256 RepID=UPI0033CC4F8B
MSWSIVEVARMSGVTKRTLRHYDEIGLLPPAGVRSNGYRFYDQTQLLRLQQILVLRELDLGLDEIAAILDRQTDRLVALREHHARLLCERDRLDRVVHTVARTIEELQAQEGTPGMSQINRPENLFEGFDPSRYEPDALKRWPDQAEAFERSKAYTDSLSAEEIERMQKETTAAMIRMAELMASGTPVGDAAVQSEIDAAYQLLSATWTPDAQMFKQLAQTYLDDPSATASFDQIAPGLAAYYRDAMVVFADIRLT